MDKFERQFETLDCQTTLMEESMGSSTTLMTPQVPLLLSCISLLSNVVSEANFFTAHFLFQGQVDSLLHEMADEAG